jgi:hypothetical protein
MLSLHLTGDSLKSFSPHLTLSLKERGLSSLNNEMTGVKGETFSENMGLTL